MALESCFVMVIFPDRPLQLHSRKPSAMYWLTKQCGAAEQAAAGVHHPSTRTLLNSAAPAAVHGTMYCKPASNWRTDTPPIQLLCTRIHPVCNIPTLIINDDQTNSMFEFRPKNVTPLFPQCIHICIGSTQYYGTIFEEMIWIIFRILISNQT